MRFLFSILAVAGALGLASTANAQMAGATAAGGGAIGTMGGMAGGGFAGNGLTGSGMANGNMINGNPMARAGGQLLGGGAANSNYAQTPNMGMGANAMGRGAVSQPGVPGNFNGNNVVVPNGNMLSFRNGSNQGRAVQATGGRFGGSGNMFPFGAPTGRFSTWGGARGNFANPGMGAPGYGIAPYGGSPMFGRTARQQMYYNSGNGAY